MYHLVDHISLYLCLFLLVTLFLWIGHRLFLACKIQVMGYVYLLMWKNGRVQTTPTRGTDKLARIIYKSLQWNGLRQCSPDYPNEIIQITPEKLDNNQLSMSEKVFLTRYGNGVILNYGGTYIYSLAVIGIAMIVVPQLIVQTLRLVVMCVYWILYLIGRCIYLIIRLPCKSVYFPFKCIYWVLRLTGILWAIQSILSVITSPVDLCIWIMFLVGFKYLPNPNPDVRVTLMTLWMILLILVRWYLKQKLT